MSAKRLARLAAGTALLGIFSQLALPIGPVPLTLQLFGAGILCGFFSKKDAIFSVLSFLLLGALGAPVFYGFQGGLFHLFGLTGGFLWGLLAACPLLGQKKKGWCLLGVVLCHLLGVLQFALVSENSLWQSFLIASLPYLLKDLILTPAGVALGKRLKGLR